MRTTRSGAIRAAKSATRGEDRLVLMLMTWRRVSPSHSSTKPGNRNGSPPDIDT